MTLFTCLGTLVSLLHFAIAFQQQIPFATHDILSIPPLGFGTWNIEKGKTAEAVSFAIQTGYRHIDCAAVYGNEKEVGQGIADGLKKANIHRSDIWVTSKLWNDQ